MGRILSLFFTNLAINPVLIRGRVFVVLVLSPLLAMPLLLESADFNRWQDAEFVLNSFSEIALKNEYRRHSGKVRKWHQPIRVWLNHRVADEALHSQLMDLHLEDLKRITGHDISRVTDSKQANVTVVFSRFNEMPRIAYQMMGRQVDSALKEALCLGSIKTDANEQIISASIIIPVDQARAHGKLVSCIVEEMTQILGLVNDSTAVYPSIFNDLTPNDVLTGLDYLLLKILYDPRMQAGMSKPEALVQAQDLIMQMQRDGTIARASQEVNKGGLHALLGY